MEQCISTPVSFVNCKTKPKSFALKLGYFLLLLLCTEKKRIVPVSWLFWCVQGGLELRVCVSMDRLLETNLYKELGVVHIERRQAHCLHVLLHAFVVTW